METNVHHIYLTFPSNIKMSRDKNQFVVSNIGNLSLPDPLGQVLTTSETALKYLLYETWKADSQFMFDKVFFLTSSLVMQPIMAPKDYKVNDTANEFSLCESLQAQYPGLPNNPTHLDVLCYQMNRFCCELYGKDNIFDVNDTGFIELIACGDHLDDARELQQSILALCERIIAYKQTLPTNSEIQIYIDTTGGLRNAAMIFLIIGRILSYLGIIVKNIYYASLTHASDTLDTVYVHEIKDIYNLLDLVAGFEEFKLFGSVKTLNAYFKTNGSHNLTVLRDESFPVGGVSEDLQESSGLVTLLGAMEQFADAINISRRGDFEIALKNLRDSLEHWTVSHKAEEFDSALISFLQQPIQDRYTSLWHTTVDNELDMINAVEWCLQHDYLQQALTLFKECVPAYVINHNIIEVNRSVFETYVKEKGIAKDINIIKQAFTLFQKSNQHNESNVDINMEDIANIYRENIIQKPNEDVRDLEDLVFNEINEARSQFVERYNKKDALYKDFQRGLELYIQQLKQHTTEFLTNMKKTNVEDSRKVFENHLIDAETLFIRHIEESLGKHGRKAPTGRCYNMYNVATFLREITSHINNITKINGLSQSMQAELVRRIPELDAYIGMEMLGSTKAELNGARKVREKLYNVMNNSMQAKILCEGLDTDFDLSLYDYVREAQDIVQQKEPYFYHVGGVTIAKGMEKKLAVLIEMLSLYFEIKKARNDSNHARVEESSQFNNTEVIKLAMSRCIALIRELMADVHASFG